MDEHCEEFTQKHLRMMMKELSQVKIDADEKEQRLIEVKMELEEVILDATEKDQQLNKVNEKLTELEARLNNQNHENVNLDDITPITDQIEERMGEVAERCFDFIKLLSQIICNENDVEIEDEDEEEEDEDEFVSCALALTEDQKEKEIDTCFKVFDKEYDLSEIDALVKRLPQKIEKDYSEKVMDLFNSMEDDRFYEFGDKEIYVKVNLHEHSICREFSVYYRYFSGITPSNDRYCVFNNETVSFKTGNCYSTLFLYDHSDIKKEEEKIWFYNHVNGNNNVPSEKDITQLQFVNFKNNGRKIVPIEKNNIQVVSKYFEYWQVKFLFSQLELKRYIFKDGEDQYLLLCLSANDIVNEEAITLAKRLDIFVG